MPKNFVMRKVFGLQKDAPRRRATEASARTAAARRQKKTARRQKKRPGPQMSPQLTGAHPTTKKPKLKPSSSRGVVRPYMDRNFMYKGMPSMLLRACCLEPTHRRSRAGRVPVRRSEATTTSAQQRARAAEPVREGPGASSRGRKADDGSRGGRSRAAMDGRRRAT